MKKIYLKSTEIKECDVGYNEQNISCLHSQNYKVAIYGAVCLFIFSNTNDSGTNTSTPAGKRVKHTHTHTSHRHKHTQACIYNSARCIK